MTVQRATIKIDYKSALKRLDSNINSKAKKVLMANLPVAEYRMVLDPYAYLTSRDAGAALFTTDYLIKHDKSLFHHSLNVGIFSVIIGHELGIENYKTLFIGGLLHDIGKTLIPFSILYKPGKLNEKEFEVIKKHTLLGAHFLFKNGMLDPYILDIVRSHHIYYDGSGYPNSLNKKASNLAQIVTISDAFEAMCSKRVYSEEKTLEEARKELIKEQGTQFNPDLIDVFLEKAAEFYPVTQVKRVFKKEDSK